MSTTKTNYPALYTLITVFFFWGFIAAGNSIFIPFCKSYFSLDQFQSQLVIAKTLSILLFTLKMS
jgi:FHS family L-fucose permease-like MFS transporter